MNELDRVPVKLLNEKRMKVKKRTTMKPVDEMFRPRFFSNGFSTRFAILIFSSENLLRHVFWFFIRNLVFVILDVYSINNLLRLFDKRSRRFHSSQVTKEMRIFHNRTAHLPLRLIKTSWFELLKDMSLVKYKVNSK